MTAYEVLGVPPKADLKTVHDAYLELAWVLHPDHGGDPDKFSAVAIAWSELKNPEDRRKYDRKLALERKLCDRCKGEGKVSGFRAGRFQRGVECPQCAGKGLA